MAGSRDVDALWREGHELADAIDQVGDLALPTLKADETGLLHMQGAESTPELERFVQVLCALNLVDPRVHWAEVDPTVAASEMGNNPQSAIDLITYVCRGNRFNEGLLVEYVNNGLLTRAFRFAAARRSRDEE